MKIRSVLVCIIFVFWIGLTSCTLNSKGHESWHTDEEITTELSNKWGRTFTLVSSGLDTDGEDMLWYFIDEDEIETTVYGHRSFYFGGASDCSYADNYNVAYVYANEDTIFEPLNEKGYDVKRYEWRISGAHYDTTSNYFANIESADELDQFLIDSADIIPYLEPVNASWIGGTGIPGIGVRKGDKIYTIYDYSDSDPQRTASPIRESDLEYSKYLFEEKMK